MTTTTLSELFRDVWIGIRVVQEEEPHFLENKAVMTLEEYEDRFTITIREFEEEYPMEEIQLCFDRYPQIGIKITDCQPRTNAEKHLNILAIVVSTKSESRRILRCKHLCSCFAVAKMLSAPIDPG